MCVNDLICQGAEPLFFLDYFATDKLRPKDSRKILEGIVNGCKKANIALIGGETAEMPGMYKSGEFDLAGFAIGALNRGTEIPRDINSGDTLIGLLSSGLHSNGFSLVRKILRSKGMNVKGISPFSQLRLGNELLLQQKFMSRPFTFN